MKKLSLNKETLVRLSADKLATVNGAIPVGGWTNACRTVNCASGDTLCYTEGSGCNTDVTCVNPCHPIDCTGGMSAPPTGGTQ